MPEYLPLKVGQHFGRYRIEDKLGAGAMGMVCLATDTELERKVAIKIPKVADSADSETLDRFYREARAAAVLQHRNICPVFDIGEENGRPFITMVYLEGRLLSEFVDAENPMPARQAAIVIRKLAAALVEAHAHNIVHRDLKPANIMIAFPGRPLSRNTRCGQGLDLRGSHRRTHRKVDACGIR